ncbi:glycosyltransferase [Paracholeplasma brassicae]|uniref:Glycosyltransferase n=1 Tax=Acholeplasma brassicae TaxID=61635 RepID=U4KSL3_9MOLU|nr:glycosyltransferase [Paracholeplasma brassicae]CCV65139.1 glycosyltransferase [Paracholeplasma brassicae]
MIKIAFIIPSLEMGGSEQKVIDLASGLDPKVFKPIIITVTKFGALLPKAEALGIRVLCTNKKGKFDFSVKNRIAKILKDGQIDIVQVFTSTGKIWGRLGAIKNHTKVIISTEESLFRNGFIDRFLERRLNSKTDWIIANSQATKRSALGATKISETKYQVIHNGIRLEPFLSSKPTSAIRTSKDEFIITTVARFDPRKRLDLLIDAFSKCPSHTKLVLIGSGKLDQALKDQVKGLNLESRVAFLGTRNDIPTLLKESDLFVLPSDEEGFGNVILEAMASNLAVVASNVGGIPEIIQHERNGLLFEKGNLEALTNSINRMIDDHLLREKLKTQASKDVYQYRLNEMVKAHEKTYLMLYQSKVK